MSRIFWDTMLFIYLIDGHPEFSEQVNYLLERSLEREDSLYTSHLAMGEVLAGAAKSPYPAKARKIRDMVTEAGFKFLSFDGGCVEVFGQLRSKQRLKIADAIHLACAASAGMDLVMTGDKDLTKVKVPGIHFIANFKSPIL
jgi:predicted nucleic acid-binding protein